MADPRPAHLDRTIALARLALGFERLWSASLWPTLVAGATASLILSGLLPKLPGWAGTVLLAAAGLAFLASLSALFRLSWPSRAEAIRRVEERSALSHRPVTGLDDRLAGGDPLQAIVWEEHRLRQLRAVADVKAGAARSF